MGGESVPPRERLDTLPWWLPERTLGYHAAAWMMDNLVQPNGSRAGLPFIPTDRQIQFLLHWYALNEKGEFIYRHGVRRLAKGSGKLVALETPVFTPVGWRRYGDLAVGDEVFGADGRPTRVKQAHPVGWQPSYRVTLSDGSSVDVGEEHLFTVDEFVGSRRRVRRTLEVRDMLREGLKYKRPLTTGRTKATSPDVGKFAMPEVAPLQMPEADLPVDPYVLGVWLADGDSSSGAISFDDRDGEWIGERLAEGGFPLGQWREDDSGGHGRRATAMGLVSALKGLGVLGRERIPREYLMASEGQRRRLLAGLLDSGGYVSMGGKAEFCQVRKQIADDVAFLLRSLGVRVRVKESDAKLYGRVTGKRYRLHFTTYRHQELFTMPRKAERVREMRRLPMPRIIKSITPIEPVPMRCITVEAEDGLFVIGDEMIVTHNSPFAASVALFELCGPCRFDAFDDGEAFGVKATTQKMPLIQVVATSEKQPLALDTRVPVVGGWSTVGDLRAGDMVFSSDGTPTPVLGSTRVFHDRQCFRVHFDDAQSVVADGAHGWSVERRRKHGDGFDDVTMTTVEMLEYLDGKQARSIRVPVVPRVTQDVEVGEVSPYLLGFWLGDGSTGGSTFAIDWRLRDEIRELFEGEVVPWDDLHFRHDKGNAGRVYVRRRKRVCPRGHSYHDGSDNLVWRNGNPGCRKCLCYPRSGMNDPYQASLRERLRSIGVLGDKHIPDSYMHAGYRQRLALLQGLVDSDGCVTEKGMVVFTNKNMRLIDQFVELAEGLGQKCRVLPAYGGAQKVTFIPHPGFQACKMKHKASRLPVDSRPLSAYRRVVKVEPVPSVPVKCIEVGTDDHLFQVEGGILTHNTANTIRMIRAFAKKGSRLHKKYDLDIGKTYIDTPEMGRLEQVTSSAHTLEGAEVSFQLGDESEHWLPSQGGPALMQTLKQNAAKTGARIMETSNAWIPGEGSVAESSFEDWCSQEEGKTRGEMKTLYDARIAPHNAVLHDDPKPGEMGLTEALNYVYEDSPWVNLRAIKEQIWDTSYPESRSLRFFFNRPEASENTWVPLDEWVLLADRDREVRDGEPIVMFFDGSKSNDHTALVGCCMEDGHVFKIGHWAPEKSTGNVNVGAVDLAVRQAFERWDVVAFWADVREWESFVRVSWPDEFGDRLICHAVGGGMNASPIAWDMRSHAYQFAEAAETAFNEIQEKAFTHDGDGEMGVHVSNCRVNEFRGRFSVKKESPKSPKKIDIAVCMIGARMLYRHVKASKDWESRMKPKSEVVFL